MAEPASQGRQFTGNPIISQFADDPHMRESIRFFSDELADCIELVVRAMQRNDRSAARLALQQLREAAAGYGYPELTSAAAEVLEHLSDSSAEGRAVMAKIDELTTLAGRVIAGSQLAAQ